MQGIKRLERMEKGQVVGLLLSDGIVRTKKEAEAWLARYIPLEKVYQKAIIEYLKSRSDCVFWKNAAGVYQKQGVPDLTVIVQGVFFGFEVKRPLIGSPSEMQLKMQQKVRLAGGTYEFVSFPEEVKDIIEGRLKDETERESAKTSRVP